MAEYASLIDALKDHLENLLVIRARIYPYSNNQQKIVQAVDVRLIAPADEGRFALLRYQRENTTMYAACAKVHQFMFKAEVTPILQEEIGTWVEIMPWLQHLSVVFYQQEEQKPLSIRHPMILQDLARIDMWLGCIHSFSHLQNISSCYRTMHDRLQGFLLRQNKAWDEAIAAITS